MDLKLDPEAVQSIAATAIFESLDANAREEILKQAIQQLLTPEKDRSRYGYGKTPLQRAFDQAISEAAFRAVREKIEADPEVQARIDELMGPLVSNAVTEMSADYQDGLASAIGSALGAYLAQHARDSR
jgi:hypothetical protein